MGSPLRRTVAASGQLNLGLAIEPPTEREGRPLRGLSWVETRPQPSQGVKVCFPAPTLLRLVSGSRLRRSWCSFGRQNTFTRAPLFAFLRFAEGVPTDSLKRHLRESGVSSSSAAVHSTVVATRLLHRPQNAISTHPGPVPILSTLRQVEEIDITSAKQAVASRSDDRSPARRWPIS